MRIARVNRPCKLIAGVFVGQVLRIYDCDLSRLGQGLIEAKFSLEELPLPLCLGTRRTGIVSDDFEVLLNLSLQKARGD